MKRIRVSHQARLQLIEIWQYNAENNGDEHASTRVRAIYQVIEQLARFPKLGTVSNQTKLPTRRLVAGPYNIYYGIQRNTIVIYRVLSGRQKQAESS